MAGNSLKNNYLQVLLALSAWVVYAVTLDYPFFFDDLPNIVDHSKIHCSSVFDVFYRNFFQGDNGFAKRPLSYASFAVNWAISKDNTASYRLVNILIHSVAAIMLFKSILLLFKTPAGKRINAPERGIAFTAAIAAALWALNPIQTQAVTYIVQRMASMAALLCILSLFFYLKARTDYSLEPKKKISFLFLAFLCFVLGFFSKENAALLPLFILLIEFVFFDNIKLYSRKNALILLGTLAFIFLFAQLFTEQDIINSILKGYSDRPFTLKERFLTQFRVVFYYLTQIFYPIPQRLSLLHSTNVSVSLLEPVTTILSILFFAGAATFAVLKKYQYPLISFAILFFIAGHLVESTIIPLELVYEHRNYLPSMFIFLPVAFYLYKLAEFYKNRNTAIEIMLYAFVVLLMIGFGTGTYARNLTWSSQKSMWEDCIRKANTMRAWQNLAYYHYGNTNQGEIRKHLYQKSLKNRNTGKLSSKILVYQNLASIYYGSGKFDRAEKYWEKALPLITKKIKIGAKTFWGLSMLESKRKNYTAAVDYIDKAIQKWPDKKYYRLKGVIYMQMGNNDSALSSFRKCLRTDPSGWEGPYAIGAFLTVTGHHERGYWFLRRALKNHGGNYLEVMLQLIQNRTLAGNMLSAENYARTLINKVSHKEILDKINYFRKNDHVSFPVYTDQLLPVIEKQYRAAAEQFTPESFETSER